MKAPKCRLCEFEGNINNGAKSKAEMRKNTGVIQIALRETAE